MVRRRGIPATLEGALPSTHRPAGTLALVALASLAVVGCGEGTEGRSGPIEVPAAALHVVGGAESIAGVEDLAVLPDGTVWVLNSVEPFFVGFAPRGDVVAAHGQAGDGPDEFGAPSGFVVGGWDGEAWVLDSRRHALIRISRPDAERLEIPLPREVFPPGSVLTGMSLLGSTVRTARMGDRVVVPRRAGTGEIEATSFWTTIWNADLVGFDPGSGSARTLLSLGEVMGDLTAHFETSRSGFPPFPLWYRLWAVCADEVRFYDFVGDELRGFGPEGVEVDPIPVPPPFTEATPRQIARTAFDLAAAEQAGALTPEMAEMSAADSSRLVDAVVQRLDGTPEQLGGLLPKFVDFRCADDGTMWLRPLDLERGGMEGGPHWLRVTPDGETRDVRLPERFDPYRFTSDRIWGVLRDELDVPSVAWVEAPGDS